MIKHKYKIIGVMSGTSLDGIDLVYTSFIFDTKWHFEIIFGDTVSYDSSWLQKLKDLVLFSETELKQIDIDYTVYLAGVINDFIVKYNIKDIDAVCSHGHTALHRFCA